jgi:2-succinyl-5-enolpyruvyl-6-hydroxy-3-cyclohexene-1-carboxylate synthase
LALAAAGGRLETHVFIDERSASFAALGCARATGKPAVLVCTSGTATANFFPAVQEAHHGRVPLLVLTADRPPELRHTGANQTIDQVKLYGDAVRWFVEVGVPDEATPPSYWRSLAGRQ